MKKKGRVIKILSLIVVVVFALCYFGGDEKDDIDLEEVKEELEQGTVQEESLSDLERIVHSPDIRVLLQAGNYDSIYHGEIVISFPSGGYVLCLSEGRWMEEEVGVGESIQIGLGSGYDYNMLEEEHLALIPKTIQDTLVVSSIQRNRVVCGYSGRLEITKSENGLLLTNVLSLEDYLKSVLPSEMPASYEREALEAQAILARTYAYKYLLSPAYLEYAAHVDDSVMYQVYGNLEIHEKTTEAVMETTGKLLFQNMDLAQVYFYSTSCGVGTDAAVWGGEGSELELYGRRIGSGTLQTEDKMVMGGEAESLYLDSLEAEEAFRYLIENPLPGAYEELMPWFRWFSQEIAVDAAGILSNIKERYQSAPSYILSLDEDGEFVSREIRELGEILDIRIEQRGASGVVESCIVEGSLGTYQIQLEYNIRYVLSMEGARIYKQDGSASSLGNLLPSGFFYLQLGMQKDKVETYTIIGGGYGHGVGVSQNAANQMALAGMNDIEIIQFFYPGTSIIEYETTSESDT